MGVVVCECEGLEAAAVDVMHDEVRSLLHQVAPHHDSNISISV
jgi:hypothetical protein